MVFIGKINDVSTAIKVFAKLYGGMEEDAHWAFILYKLDRNIKVFNNAIRRAAGLQEIEQ